MSDGDGRDLIESERDVLLFFLNRVRDAVVLASAGLTGEQQRMPGVPSGTSLPGLIKHLTAVEEHWFQSGSSWAWTAASTVHGRARRRDPR